MAIAGGLSSQVGLAEEVTFGTYAVPTRFYELTQESVKYSRERIESKGLRTGRRTLDKWVSGRQGGEGDVEFEVMPNGFGIVAKHMLGAVTTATPGGATLARLHTAKVGALDAKSLTVQFGRTGRAGTTDPYSYTGSKVMEWELEMPSDGLLTCKLGLDASGEDTATALATASYPTTNVLLPFSNTSTSITIGGTSYDVDKVTLKGTNALATSRYRLGAPTKLEQLEGAGMREYMGTVDLESYAGLTPYNLFTNGTEAAIVCTFSGAIIEAALAYMVRVTLPRCRFDGETTTIGGPELLPQKIPFKALWTSAATTEVQIEVQNTDTAA
jgi:Phage tail tube protein